MESVPEQTDEELMKQYITGNPTAFEQLALRYEKIILNFAYPYFRNIPQSEDIVQDVFVRVVESKDKYDPDKKILIERVLFLADRYRPPKLPWIKVKSANHIEYLLKIVDIIFC